MAGRIQRHAGQKWDSSEGFIIADSKNGGKRDFIKKSKNGIFSGNCLGPGKWNSSSCQFFCLNLMSVGFEYSYD